MLGLSILRFLRGRRFSRFPSPYFDMQLTLADLRALGAMAQFNRSEMRVDALRLIETSGDLPSDTRIEMTAKHCRIVNANHPSVIDQDPPDDRDDDDEETLPCQIS